MEQTKKKNLILTLFAFIFAILSAAFSLSVFSYARADELEDKTVIIEKTEEEKTVKSESEIIDELVREGDWDKLAEYLETRAAEKCGETKTAAESELPVLSEEEAAEKLNSVTSSVCLKGKYIIVNPDDYGFSVINGRLAVVGDEIWHKYTDSSSHYHNYGISFISINYGGNLYYYFHFLTDIIDDEAYMTDSSYVYYSDTPLLFDEYVAEPGTTPEDPTPDDPTPGDPTPNDPTPDTAESNVITTKKTLGVSGGLIAVAVAGAVIFIIIRRKK